MGGVSSNSSHGGRYLYQIYHKIEMTKSNNQKKSTPAKASSASYSSNTKTEYYGPKSNRKSQSKRSYSDDEETHDYDYGYYGPQKKKVKKEDIDLGLKTEEGTNEKVKAEDKTEFHDNANLSVGLKTEEGTNDESEEEVAIDFVRPKKITRKMDKNW